MVVISTIHRAPLPVVALGLETLYDAREPYSFPDIANITISAPNRIPQSIAGWKTLEG